MRNAIWEIARKAGGSLSQNGIFKTCMYVKKVLSLETITWNILNRAEENQFSTFQIIPGTSGKSLTIVCERLETSC